MTCEAGYYLRYKLVELVLTPGGDSNMKTTVLRHGLKFSSPLRATNSFITYHQLAYFPLNTLPGTAKAPAVVILRLNTLLK